MSQESKRKIISVGMAIGISVGVALGAVLDNVGLGIALGVAIGGGLGSAFSARTQAEPTRFLVLGGWFVMAVGIAAVVLLIVY